MPFCEKPDASAKYRRVLQPLCRMDSESDQCEGGRHISRILELSGEHKLAEEGAWTATNVNDLSSGARDQDPKKRMNIDQTSIHSATLANLLLRLSDQTNEKETMQQTTR